MTAEQDAQARAQSLYEAGVRGMAASFDAERGLLRQITDAGAFYPTRENLRYARCLLRDDDAAAQERGVAILAAVLAVQERQPGNIHAGNWPWMFDDGHVTDLNAVQFEIEILTHLLLESAAKLAPPLRAAAREALALGLAEIARLDVDVAYSNICLLDVHNSILGGRVLGLPGWCERGHRKLVRWAAYTAQSGAPREYNSPTYGGVDVVALASVAEYAPAPATRFLARLLEERLWLHTATHYHAPTAQIAGPHSRAYHNDVTGGRGILKTILYRVLDDERLYRVTPFYAHRQGEGNVDVALAPFHLPPPLRALFDTPLPATVRETADAAEGLDLSTALTPDWTLGVASRSYGGQADNLHVQYCTEAAPGFGVAFTRFVMNGKRLGNTYNASDRTWVNNLSDDGVFRGLHHRNTAIGVYGLAPQSGDMTRAALDVFFVGNDGSRRVLLGGSPVGSLPVELPADMPLVVEDGAVYIGVRPLRHSNLGRHAPVRLEERDNDLVLSVVVYEGPPKQFWEYRTLSGPFYRGNIESGVIVQIASRSEYASAEAFAASLAAAQLDDATTDGVRTIRYRSGGDDLLLRYRLHDMEIIERRVNGEPYIAPALASPHAVQATRGPLTLAGYTLTGVTDTHHWLYTDPQGEQVVATRTSNAAEPWSLHLPNGASVTITAPGPLRLTYTPKAGTLDVAHAGPRGAVALAGWERQPTIHWHDEKQSVPLTAPIGIGAAHHGVKHAG